MWFPREWAVAYSESEGAGSRTLRGVQTGSTRQRIMRWSCDCVAWRSFAVKLPSLGRDGSLWVAVPQNAQATCRQGRWCEFQLSSNLTTSRTTSPSYRNPHPAAKLSTPRKPNSQWPSNRLPAYVLPLGVLGSREQGTNDWNRCSAVRSCSTFPLLRVCGELVADFWSFLQLRRSSGQCAPRTGELG